MCARLVLVFAASLVLACTPWSSPTELSPILTPDLLAYDTSPETVVVYANARITAGAPEPGQTCNYIPNLRIWGDGRVVLREYNDGQRYVYSSHYDPAQIRELLVFLEDQGIFEPRTPMMPNPAGTYSTVTINLRAGEYGFFWDNPSTPVFAEFLSLIDPGELTPYVPQEALLVVGSYPGSCPPEHELPEWPTRFGISLAEVRKSDRWVTGDALAFVWQAINDHPFPLTGFIEDGQAYAVALQIPGVSYKEPPFDCWPPGFK
jgi:hypothetical protein